MSTNDFKPFATGAGANVTNQADWQALPALQSGFQAGKASSSQVNKAIRQASFIAAALAQYVSDKAGVDTLDDGNLSGFVTKFTSAINKQSQPLDATLTALAGLATGANKLPYFSGLEVAAQTDLTQTGRDLIGKSAVSDVLSYLGLGDGTGRLIKTTVITSSQTFTKDPSMKFCRVRIVGGGGGAGGVPSTTSGGTASISGGAGAGAYAEVVLPTGSVPSSLSVVIGSGGISQATAGSDGSASSFGSIITCPGGKKSATGTLITTASSLSMGAPASDAPTINAGSVVFVTIGSGGGYAMSTAAGITSGEGGSSFMGSGGPARYAGSGSQAGGGPGAGGSGVAIGSASSALNGGAGIDGRCIIEEYA
ncbi:hypothetical protein [Rahnella inusitata]|uniref:glycine-rich domain-containing protein n=1 Tax=Rahnella inusitata TaxID=58169 RepID=UPI001BC82F11|nr:hypothetical protein [Rahnella inusitata]QUT14060.1 hypothetical protein I2123_15285 [Rahnella inusitata]